MASLCDESRTPISCHCAYTGAGGKPDCFDLAHGAYEVRPADAYRRSFWPAAHFRGGDCDFLRSAWENTLAFETSAC